MIAGPRTYLEHFTRLDKFEHSKPKPLTGIYCSIREDAEMEEIKGLVENGMTVAKMFFTKDDEDENIKMLRTIRKAGQEFSKELPYPMLLAVAVDTYGLGGLEINTIPTSDSKRASSGPVKEQKPEETEGDQENKEGPTPVQLEVGKKVQILYAAGEEERSDQDTIYMNFVEMYQYVAEGSIIKIGLEIVLTVEKVTEEDDEGTITCVVDQPGALSASLPIEVRANEAVFTIIRKDKMAIRLGVDQDVAVIIASSIVNAKSVEEVRKIACGTGTLIFSKIDNKYGVKNIDEIIAASDGIFLTLVAEKLDTTPEKVPAIQTMIISKCNIAGKPVVVPAPPMNDLEDHAIHKPTAITSLVNSVIDGTYSTNFNPDWDSFSPEILKTIEITQKEAENSIWFPHVHQNLTWMQLKDLDIAESVAISAVKMSFTCDACCIIVISNNGRSANLIAKYSPKCPIIALSRRSLIARQFQLFKGILPIFYDEPEQNSWTKEVNAQYNYALKYKEYLEMKQGEIIFVHPAKADGKFADYVKVLFDYEKED